MDIVLGTTTLLVNLALGWTKGVWWIWLVHAANATAWIPWACSVGPAWGIIGLSVATIILDLWSCWKHRPR
jgi:hypothetical protein